MRAIQPVVSGNPSAHGDSTLYLLLVCNQLSIPIEPQRIPLSKSLPFNGEVFRQFTVSQQSVFIKSGAAIFSAILHPAQQNVSRRVLRF